MPVNKRRGPIIFQDKMVLFLLVFLLLGEDSGAIWMLYLTIPSTAESAITIWDWATRILSIFIILHLPVIICLDPYRYIVWFRFTQEGIEYHTLFRRKKILPYANYPYLLHGRYLHGVYWRHYIIFSDRRLKEVELNQINHVAPSTRMIKVQYSKKTYCALEAVLPSKMRACLTAIRWENP